MQVIDLTQTIGETMPVYPGTERPKLTQTNTIEKDGFKETLLRRYSHTGDVYKRQVHRRRLHRTRRSTPLADPRPYKFKPCLLYTSRNARRRA